MSKSTKNQTLNPYRFAAYQFLNRLRWDVRPRAIVDRKKFARLGNRYLNGKAVILCNGPSLNSVDFGLLEGCYVIGLNKINLLFDRTEFRPDCIVASNMHVIDQNQDFYNTTDIELYLDCKAYTRKIVAARPNVTYFHSALIPGFARDCSFSINPSHTVTNTALQIAYHMGFTSLAIVGADHNFAVSGEPNTYVRGIKKDYSHFDTSYFADVEWQLPDLAESEVGYLRAKHAFERDGRQIYNATDGGKLEIFERLDLAAFIGL